MTTPLTGKTVCLTGTFSQMKRSEAAAKLAAFGATFSKSLTRKVDLLVYGDKAGSKLAKAEGMGIEARPDTWLMAIFEGQDADEAEAASAVTLEGPLSDYMERVDALATALYEDKRVEVGYFRAPPVHPDTLARQATRWGVEAWSPALSNLYLQADGFLLYWVESKHEKFRELWRDGGRKPLRNYRMFGGVPAGTKPPSSTMIFEDFPWELGGAIWVLPASKALHRKKSFVDFSFDGADELTDSIRLFDAADTFYPVGLSMTPGDPSPQVLMGDDHGGPWEDSARLSLEEYMERALALCGIQRTRAEMSRYKGLKKRYERGQAEPFARILKEVRAGLRASS